MIKQRVLVKSINLRLNNKCEVGCFIKINPVLALIINEENQKRINDIIKIDFSQQYPSCDFKLGTIDKVNYDLNNQDYIENIDGNTLIKKGVAIIFQKTKTGVLDIYPNPNIMKNYKKIEDKIYKKEITGVKEIDDNLELFIKNNIVEMISYKTLSKYLMLKNKGNIETSFGTQEYNEESFFVLEKDKNNLVINTYVVQKDVDGLPINYVKRLN